MCSHTHTHISYKTWSGCRTVIQHHHCSKAAFSGVWHRYSLGYTLSLSFQMVFNRPHYLIFPLRWAIKAHPARRWLWQACWGKALFSPSEWNRRCCSKAVFCWPRVGSTCSTHSCQSVHDLHIRLVELFRVFSMPLAFQNSSKRFLHWWTQNRISSGIITVQ